MATMDLEVLLERLEKAIDEGHRLPFTNKVLVDEEYLFSLIDEIRHELPEEFRQARAILREREAVLAEAREEAENMLREARERTSALVDETAVAQEAQMRAEEILEQARATAREIKVGARAYADEILGQLENHLGRLLEVLRRNRDELRPPHG